VLSAYGEVDRVGREAWWAGVSEPARDGEGVSAGAEWREDCGQSDHCRALKYFPAGVAQLISVAAEFQYKNQTGLRGGLRVQDDSCVAFETGTVSRQRTTACSQ
jgi:hypothetical protein